MPLYECSGDICPVNSPPTSPAPDVSEFVDDVIGPSGSTQWPGSSISHWESIAFPSTGRSILEFSVENFPNNSSGGDEGPEESVVFVYGKLGSDDDGWCMAIEVDVPDPMERVHALYDLVF
jgi:hypothetical protein